MRTVPFWNFYTFLLTFDGIGCLYSSAESTFHGKFKSIFEHAYCSEENKLSQLILLKSVSFECIFQIDRAVQDESVTFRHDHMLGCECLVFIMKVQGDTNSQHSKTLKPLPSQLIP